MEWICFNCLCMHNLKEGRTSTTRCDRYGIWASPGHIRRDHRSYCLVWFVPSRTNVVCVVLQESNLLGALALILDTFDPCTPSFGISDGGRGRDQRLQPSLEKGKRAVVETIAAPASDQGLLHNGLSKTGNLFRKLYNFGLFFRVQGEIGSIGGHLRVRLGGRKSTDCVLQG